MIRVKISSFIRKHKYKIYDLGKKLVIVAMIVFVATIILSSLSGVVTNEEEDKSNVYKPTDAIISGSSVSKEQYEQDSNLVNKFIEYCNNKQVEEAYSLLSDECKEEAYPTIERFKENYYNYIFSRKRECNLQAWISNSNYTIYKVRYTNNMLATGTYDEDDVYQDYLTLNKKSDTEKISIGNFVDYIECDITTTTDEIDATVVKKKTYLFYEEYEINIKNKTLNTILLDNLKNSKTIRLITSTGKSYKADINAFLIDDLIVKPLEVKKITIMFRKNLSSVDNTSEEIEFSNIIKDYNTYIKNEEEYTDIINVTISLED